MPTGYTAIIEDGDGCTFEEFVWRCARAFGAAIMLRDNGLDTPLTPEAAADKSTYHIDAIAKTKAKLAEVQGMTVAQAEAMARAEYEQAIVARDKSIARSTEESRRYDEMRKRVADWTPPSPEHASLRSFMLDQIRVSTEYGPYVPEMPKLLTGAEWIASETARAERDIAYHVEHQAKQDEANRIRVGWVRALAEAVPMPKTNRAR